MQRDRNPSGLPKPAVGCWRHLEVPAPSPRLCHIGIYQCNENPWDEGPEGCTELHPAGCAGLDLQFLT